MKASDEPGKVAARRPRKAGIRAGEVTASRSPAAHVLSQLQPLIGNRAVTQLVQRQDESEGNQPAAGQVVGGFHVYASGMAGRVSAVQPYLAQMPGEHRAVLDPIFIVEALHGGRTTGGGYTPPGRARQWLGRQQRTGVPDEVLERVVLAPGKGIIAITRDAMQKNIAHFTVLHEAAHSVDHHLGIVPPGATVADFRGVRYPRPSVGEYAAETYARYVINPRRVGRRSELSEGETMAACSRRLTAVLMRSPAFSGAGGESEQADVPAQTPSSTGDTGLAPDEAPATTGSHEQTPGRPDATQTGETAADMVFTEEEVYGSGSPGSMADIGARRNRGWAYNGSGSAAHAERKTRQVAALFRQAGYEDHATGAELFLATGSGREGYPSAINTWDSKTLTWGTGFAAGGMLEPLWAELPTEVKAVLESRAPNRFSSSGIRIDPSVRRDEQALAALVHVAESPQYADQVYRAQLKVFLTHTLGLSWSAAPGTRTLPTREAEYLYLGARLRHAAPAFWDFREDTQRALRMAGGDTDREPAPWDFAAACVRVWAENMQGRGRFETEDGRLVAKLDRPVEKENVEKWRRRLLQFSERMTPESHGQAAQLVPALSSTTYPFFHGVRRLNDIDAGHLVFVEEVGSGTLVSARRAGRREGRRRIPHPDAPQSGGWFYDIGPS